MRSAKRSGKLAMNSRRPRESSCAPGPAAHALLAKAVTRLGLSARAFHRIAKVARTIADLAGNDAIEAGHVAEALGYRREHTPVG